MMEWYSEKSAGATVEWKPNAYVAALRGDNWMLLAHRP